MTAEGKEVPGRAQREVEERGSCWRWGRSLGLSLEVTLVEGRKEDGRQGCG